MSNTKEVRIQFVKRPIPKKGPTTTDDYNSCLDEISVDLNALGDAWNKEAYPILNTLPQGSADTRWTLSEDLNPFTYGLDGAHIFMDNEASESTDEGRFWYTTYTDTSRYRPKTLKEVSSHLYDEFDTLKEEITDQVNGISSGLSDDQWSRVGYWIRDGGAQTGPVDSLYQRFEDMNTDIDNTIDDIFTSGDPPATRLLITSATIQQVLTELLTIHGGDWAQDPTSPQIVHGTFTDGEIPQVAVDNGDTTPMARAGVVDTLVDDLNRMRYELGRLKDLDSSHWGTQINFPTIGGEMSLYGHLGHVGTGTVTTTNPHAMSRAEVDGVNTEFAAIQVFLGKADGADYPSYTESNYVTGGAGHDIEEAIDDLDMSLKDHIIASDPHNVTLEEARTNSNLLAGNIDMNSAGTIVNLPDPVANGQATSKGWVESYIDTWLAGKNTGNLTEGSNLYYTEDRVSANTNVAANTAHRASTHTERVEYTFNNHVDINEPIEVSHGRGIAFPLVQVIDVTTGDYTGVLVDENYVYEQEQGIITSDAFVSVEFIDVDNFHVYTNVEDGVVIAVF